MMERRSFLKGLVSLIGGAAILKELPQSINDNVLDGVISHKTNEFVTDKQVFLTEDSVQAGDILALGENGKVRPIRSLDDNFAVGLALHAVKNREKIAKSVLVQIYGKGDLQHGLTAVI